MFVIAHRGANRFAPQNTLPAFSKAIELNSDGVETDIHITADGHFVLCHNGSVEKTSNGKGRIPDLTLKELKALDFGSRFGNGFVNIPIPTLDEFLQLMKKSASTLNIELKPQKNKSLDFVEKVIDKVKEYGLEERLFISSFDRRILERVKSVDPAVKTGYLYPAMGEIVRRWLVSPVALARSSGVDFLLPHQSYVSRAFIKKAHDAGLRVAVWTVNKTETAEKLMNWGADGIITDCPDIIKRKIESM